MAMSNRDSWRLLCAVSRTKPTRHMKVIIKMQDAPEAAYIVIEEPWDMPAMVACKRIDVGTLHVLPVLRSWVSRVLSSTISAVGISVCYSSLTLGNAVGASRGYHQS